MLQVCEAARGQLVREGERLKSETRQRDAERAAHLGVVYAAPAVPPSVNVDGDLGDRILWKARRAITRS